MNLWDSLTAYQFDTCVTTFGLVVDGALNIRDEVGEGANRQSLARYTLRELLDPAFKLPREDADNDLVPLRQGTEGIVYDEVR